MITQIPRTVFIAVNFRNWERQCAFSLLFVTLDAPKGSATEAHREKLIRWLKANPKAWNMKLDLWWIPGTNRRGVRIMAAETRPS